VAELIAYFRAPEPGQVVRAVPGAGLDVPLWILGSSLYGAQLAAAFGLPYAFASHFAPRLLSQALETYRTNFRPSAWLAQPYVMLGVNVFAADSDDEARRLFTSLQQAFVNLRRGHPGPLPPPVDDIDDRLTPMDRLGITEMLACSIVGSPETVERGIASFVAATEADELMVTSQIFDHAARLRSYEITAQARERIGRE
jgi:luciferase family oxidoreductase group 1